MRIKKFPEDSTTLLPATLWRRLAAMFYDGMLLIAIWLVTTMAYLVLVGISVGEETLRASADSGGLTRDPILPIALFLITFFFFAYFWRKIGQTLGMQVWRIRIQTLEGNSVSWGQCLLRFIGAAVSAAPLGLGYLWMLWDKEGRTWHDIYSMTRVVSVSAKPKK